MKKIRLLTPGPTPVPERLSLRMARPIVHHRSPEFEAVFGRVREGLGWLFQTKQDVLVFAASGTGAMEAAFVNFLRKGDTAVVVDGGKFGERWGKFAKAYGVNAVTLKCEWGHPVDPAAVTSALRENPQAKAVYVQANESSTGVYHPIRELAQVTAKTGAILVVDAISALGAMTLPMDEWGIDVLVSAGHKALGLPPGIAFLAAGEKAWKLNESADLPASTSTSSASAKTSARTRRRGRPPSRWWKASTSRSPCSARRAWRTSSRAMNGWPGRRAPACRRWG